jgi:diguanylate cyclase (GGDEF)-like protein
MLDTATGPEMSFSIFYLIPVAFAGAFLSNRAGQSVALLSAAVWGYLEIVAGRAYSYPWIPYWNSAVRFGFFLLVNGLMDALLRAIARERKLSRTDVVTGIPNGRVFHEHVERTIAASRRNGRPFTIVYADLDRFKQVNDQFGHSEGDRLLRLVASNIKESLRSTDTLARVGGDEFGILLPETEAAQARVSLERMAAALSREIGREWSVGVTIGAVTFSEPPENTDRAISHADALMYRGKAEGRGRILQAVWPDMSSGASAAGL